MNAPHDVETELFHLFSPLITALSHTTIDTESVHIPTNCYGYFSTFFLYWKLFIHPSSFAMWVDIMNGGKNLPLCHLFSCPSGQPSSALHAPSSSTMERAHNKNRIMEEALERHERKAQSNGFWICMWCNFCYWKAYKNIFFIPIRNIYSDAVWQALPSVKRLTSAMWELWNSWKTTHSYLKEATEASVEALVASSDTRTSFNFNFQALNGSRLLCYTQFWIFKRPKVLVVSLIHSFKSYFQYRNE